MDDRRLLLFFALSLAVMVAWSMLVPSTPPPPPAGEAVEEAIEEPFPTGEEPPAAPSPAPSPAPALATGPPTAAVAERAVVLRHPRFEARFTNRGGQLLSFRLRRHQDDDGEPLELVRSRAEGPYPLALVGPGVEPHPLADVLYAARETTSPEGWPGIEFTYRGPEGAARKAFGLRPDGLLDVTVAVEDGAGWGLLLGPGIGNPDPDEIEGRYAGHKVVYRQGDEVETVVSAKLDEVEELPPAGLRWVGLEDTYFLTALLPRSPLFAVAAQPVTVATGEEGEPWRLVPFTAEQELDGEAEDLPRDARLVVRPRGDELAARVYLGAKEYDQLDAIGQGLVETIEWGMLGVLARPLLVGLVWIHDRMVANYGWAIVLMTAFLKLILLPLTHKSYVSMQKMQKVQPRLQAVRQKYRGKLRDKRGRLDLEAQRKMNEETQAILREEGVNPAGGCLPMLLQIPVFFAFFRLLLTAVELRREPWLLWVRDLSRPDPLYILPVVMGLTQIYQQKLTPMSGDPMQRRIMQLFPWMFMIFALGFPSGLVLYWTTNNVLTIVQTRVYKALREGDDGPKKAPRGPRRKKRRERG